MVSYFLVGSTYRLFVAHQQLEFFWTLVPCLLLISLALPSLSLLYLLDEVGTPAITQHITGYQWYWSYSGCESVVETYASYLTSGPLRNLSTDSSLRLPSGLVLRLLVTSSDVLHSWALPAFGLKADCVPGRLNSLSSILDRPGIFYGQCSEICGANHSFIPISVVVSLFLKG